MKGPSNTDIITANDKFNEHISQRDSHSKEHAIKATCYFRRHMYCKSGDRGMWIKLCDFSMKEEVVPVRRKLIRRATGPHETPWKHTVVKDLAVSIINKQGPGHCLRRHSESCCHFCHWANVAG